MFKGIRESFNIIFNKPDFVLNVPYADKDEAKQLGAVYSVENRSWVVPWHRQHDILDFTKWIPKETLQKAFFIFSLKENKERFVKNCRRFR